MASRFILPYADVGNGISPSNGAQLFFYTTGTTTLKDTYSDEALSTANANPVIADADGVFGDVWLADGARYKVTLKDKDGVQIWESDPIVGAPSDSLMAKMFDNLVTDLDSSAEVFVGDIVETAGYTTKGDGGSNTYEIVAAGTGTDDGGSYIDLTTSGLQAKGLFPNGRIDVKQFGAVGDGTTSDRVAIKNVYVYAKSSGLDVYFSKPTTHYRILAASSAETIIPSIGGVRSYGSGKVVFESNAAANAVTGVDIDANNTIIEGVQWEVKSESTSALLCTFSGTCKNISIINNTFTTDSFTTEYNANLFKVADNAQVTYVDFSGNFCDKFRYGLFTANAFGSAGNGGLAHRWSFKGNHFTNFTTDAIELNTNDGEATPADRPWRYVTIDGNTFGNKTTGTTNIAVGTDGGAYITISNNTFSNIIGNASSATHPIHIEHGTETIAIVGNSFVGCYGGIEVRGAGVVSSSTYGGFTIVGNTLEGTKVATYSTASSAIAAKAANNLIGIDIVTEASGAVNGLIVEGNFIRNYDVGIKIGESDNDISVKGNHISLCHSGLDIGADFRQTIAGNTISRCKYAYWTRGARGMLGKNNLINCYELFDPDNAQSGWSCVGLTWVQDDPTAVTLPNIATGVTTKIDLFTLPTEMDTKFQGFACNQASRTSRDQFSGTLTYDGSTMTPTRSFTRAAGSPIAISSAPFVVNSTNLAAQIFQATGGNIDIAYQMDFDDWIIWT
jgi:hypothetical protein